MRTNRGITIGVLSGGKMAEEYGHQNEDECTVSCFIPGEQDEASKTYMCAVYDFLKETGYRRPSKYLFRTTLPSKTSPYPSG